MKPIVGAWMKCFETADPKTFQSNDPGSSTACELGSHPLTWAAHRRETKALALNAAAPVGPSFLDISTPKSASVHRSSESTACSRGFLTAGEG